MSVPNISVIIPVYKVEKYIRECLESVLAQTMKEIEIIVVNDGTPDRSAEIAREYAAVDARMKIIDQHNQGLSAARNAGMRIASAPLVMFVDSDDVVEPDFCQKMFDALTDDADAAVCWMRFVYDYETQPIPDVWFKFDSDDMKKCNCMACNKIFRMSIIREYGIEFPVGLKHEDEFFWNAYLPWCRKISVVTEELYRYRIRKDSIMGALRSGEIVVNPDPLRIIMAVTDYYERHGLLQSDEWAEHYWRFFDRMIHSTQRCRPERFKFKKKKKFKKLRRFFGMPVK